MGEFLVVAIPNEGSYANLSTFRAELQIRIQTQEDLRPFVTVQEVTQLVDEDLGDCFVVGLVFDSTSKSRCESDEGKTVIPNETSSSNTLLEALGYSNAEVWVTSAGPIPLSTPYGWKMETFSCEQGETDAICNRLRIYGLAVVTNTSNDDSVRKKDNNQHNRPISKIPSDKGEYQNEELLTIFSRATTQLQSHVALLESTVRENHPEIQLGESAFGFLEYTHRGPHRFEVLFEPNSSLYLMLRNELEERWINSVCCYLQSDRSQLRLNISCVYSRPGATDQDWHTDGDHYSHMPTVGDDNVHLPYAVCIFVPLIPLTPETGFTRFWPKSHLYPNLLGLARAADALQATIDGVNLQPGDFVMYDYTTWHKGVGNTTENVERPIVQFLYSCDWYEEKKNYGNKSVFDIHP